MGTFADERRRLEVQLEAAVELTATIIEDEFTVPYCHEARFRQRIYAGIVNAVLFLLGSKYKLRIVRD